MEDRVDLCEVVGKELDPEFSASLHVVDLDIPILQLLKPQDREHEELFQQTLRHLENHLGFF